MAGVKGPLFSLDASGAVGDAIVFAKWKGRNYVRRHAIPANPKSVGQVSVRSMLKFLTQYWASLTAGEQADWDDRAAATDISPFNAFVGANAKRFGRYAFPSKLDPATEDGTPGTILSPTAVAGSRSILLSVPISVLADNWGVAIHSSLTTGFTPSRNTVRQVIPAESASTFTWLDFPLTVGVEVFYRFESFDDVGDSTLLVGEESATPVA
jgi:hypothetical protein